MGKRICMDCKYCNYNVMLAEYKKMCFWEKLKFAMGSGRTNLEIAYEHPMCNHPNVFRNSNSQLVYGERRNDRISCMIARECSTPCFSTCGEDGKYFVKFGEEDD